MTSTGHFLQTVDFPVYAVAWTSDNQVAVTGGGGAGRSGVKNSISLFDVDSKHQRCERVAELDLSKNEDAPSTIAVHPERKDLVLGINSDAETMKSGTNNNLRVYSYGEKIIKLESTTNTIQSKDPDVYQKITAFSKDGTKIAVASSKSQLSILSSPRLERILPDLDFDDEEMFDTDFNEDGSMFLGASSQRIQIWDTPSASSSSSLQSEAPEPSQVIQSPVLSKSLKCTFRAARFGRCDTSSRLFTIVNATSHTTAGGTSRKGKKSIERKAFITTWDTKTWNLIKTRTVAKKPITSFDVSPDGKLLALGGADLSVSIFDAETIRPLLSILAAHDFPSTCLRFSPNSKVLISGSADNTLRVIMADQALHPARHQGLQLALITMLILLIAVLVQMYAGDRVVAVARRHLHV